LKIAHFIGSTPFKDSKSPTALQY